MPRALTRTIAGACALTLLFAACSDDGGDDESTDATTTTAADEATTTTAADESTTTAADEEEPTTTEAEAPTDGGEEGDPDAIALAESINLTIDDFAGGWEAQPAGDDDETGSFNDCFVETPIRDVALGRAKTPTFTIDATEDSGQLVTMQTVVLDSPETAEAVTAEAQGEAFVQCTTDGLVGNLGDGATGQLEVVADDPPVAEESFGLAGAVVIPSEAGSSQGLIDVHLFRTRNVVSFVATIDIGETGEFESTIGSLYQAVADRHAANVR